jgi:hypothetical protein
MYINKVDDLIDRVIDDFYAVVIMKDKKIEKLKQELNFIKSQKDINEIIVNYIKTIPTAEITDIVKKGDSYTIIFDTLQRYITIYVFLTIGIFYKGKSDVFINNMIEFSRNQAEYPLKIENFFNSESNSLIIKLYYMCKNILIMLEKDSLKIESIKKEPYAEETMEFINNLSIEFIDAAFRLKSLKGDPITQANNIIKTIIVLLVYKINDKKTLYNIIEQSELSEGEYMFIDVIEPITETINFSTIESLLSKSDLFSGLAYEIWDYIEEADVKNKMFISNEDKINILINSGIIVPIIDDFMLYHRDSEKYDKNVGLGISGSTTKKKEDTKVRYIIGKIDTTTELYSDAAKKDPKLKANIMKNFSVPLYSRKAILRNNIEEIKIINKFINQGKRNTENNDYFNDLIAYRRYAYINFKDFNKYGFTNYFTKTVTSVRAVNFDTTTEFKQTNIHNRLQLRVGARDTSANIVGFMIPTNTKPIQCIKVADVINIRDLSKTNNNGFDLFLNFLKRSVIKGERHNASVYWMFDPGVDKVRISAIESSTGTGSRGWATSVLSGQTDTGSSPGPVISIPGASGPVISIPGASGPVPGIPGASGPVPGIPGASGPVPGIPGANSPVHVSGPAGQQDAIKGLVTELYNKIIKDIYFEIIDKIDLHPKITITRAAKIIRFLEKNILGIPLSRDIYEEVEAYVFEKKIVNLETSQILESDILYGLEGDTIALPVYEVEKKVLVNKLVIDLSHVEVSGEVIEAETVRGVCQHNITWDNIGLVSKTNYSEYMKLLYNFIQQYVVENTHQEYICKSCGFSLDIRKYIQDGVFDDEKGFVTFSMPMETNLEDLPEYEKYKFSIKIMDKNIEKIASSVGIPYFIGNTTTVKWRRKGIIKNTIDMVTQNNQLMSKTFKERNENKTKLYGVSKGLSNLFVFEMENNIFQTSSKDKDQEQFKMLKRNNITTYIMTYLILELNESQITFFTSDKKNMCDIRIFDKVYNSLFSGLRIKKNGGNDTVDITKYKILCYMIYMISCRIAKHRIWYSSHSTEKNIQKMIPVVQRYIVHTCIDIVNAILENSFQSGVSYIFEIFRVRFYSKLNSIFGDNAYYGLLLEQSNFSYATARKRGHLKLVTNENLPPYIYDPPKWKIEVPAKYFPEYLVKDVINLNGISNLSNCPTGEFHRWKMVSGSLVCSLCNVKMQDLKYDEKASAKIVEKYKIARLNLLAQKFCQVDGDLHQYVYDPKKKQNICIKCGKSDEHKYNADELEKIEIMIDKNNTKRREEQAKIVQGYIARDDNEKNYIKSVVDKNLENIKNDYKKENPFQFIDIFIDMLQNVIGNEIKSDYPIQLRNNTYIIDHDHNGYDLGGKEIVITEQDNKIFHKTNHPHFKTDVIYYTDKSATHTDVFYDTITRKLLGYKEASKNYVDIKTTNKKIKINYSIYNKLKHLGYGGEFININESYENLYAKQFNTNNDNDNPDIKKQNIYRTIVKDVSKIRIDNLKNTIYEFQRVFNRILNGYSETSDGEKTHSQKTYDQKTHGQKTNDQKTYNNKIKGQKIQGQKIQGQKVPGNEKPAYEKVITNYFSEKMNSLVERYKKKLRNVTMKERSGKHKVFKHWKAINRGVYVDTFEDKYFNFDSNLIKTDNISRYDAQSNSILYYIVHEFTALLKYNQDGFMKTNICNFLVEFIDKIFFMYNTEHLYINNDIKRFMYVLNSMGFLKEAEEYTAPQTDGFYEEYVDEEEPTEEDQERRVDDEEEQDALDVDMDQEDREERVENDYDRLTEWEQSY